MPKSIVTATLPARLVLVLTLLLSMLGCSRLRPVVARHEQRSDTLRAVTHRYDSIVLWHDRTTHRQGDTVVVQDLQVEYRYRHLRDTLHHTHVQYLHDTVTLTPSPSAQGITLWPPRLPRSWLAVGLAAVLLMGVLGWIKRKN